VDVGWNVAVTVVVGALVAVGVGVKAAVGAGVGVTPIGGQPNGMLGLRLARKRKRARTSNSSTRPVQSTPCGERQGVFAAKSAARKRISMPSRLPTRLSQLASPFTGTVVEEGAGVGVAVVVGVGAGEVDPVGAIVPVGDVADGDVVGVDGVGEGVTDAGDGVGVGFDGVGLGDGVCGVGEGVGCTGPVGVGYGPPGEPLTFATAAVHVQPWLQCERARPTPTELKSGSATRLVMSGSFTQSLHRRSAVSPPVSYQRDHWLA